MRLRNGEPDWVERCLRVLLATRVGLVAIVVTFACAGLWSIRAGDGFNSEGLTLVYSSRALLRAPAAVFFMLRLRPLCSLAFAPATALGIDTFLVAHLLAVAAVLPLLSSVARAWGVRLLHLPALIVASSTAVFYSANSGISTTDGMVGAIAFSWVWMCTTRRFAAGLLLGALPLLRPELALLVVIVVGYTVARARRSALLVGVLVVPLAYWAGGAVYHREVAWFIHFPAHPAHGAYGKGGLDWTLEASRLSLGRSAREVVALSPLTPLAAIALLRAPGGPPRVLALFSLLLFSFLTITPFLQLFTGVGARYLVVMLPFAAVALAGLVDDCVRGEQSAVAWLALGTIPTALCCVTVMPLAGWEVAAWLTASVVAVAIALRQGAVGVALVGITQTLLVAAACLSPLDGARDERVVVAKVVDWLESRRLPRPDAIVFTNEQLLAPMLEKRLGRSGRDVHFFFQDDITFTLAALSNQQNGQRRALFDALRDANGTTLFGEDMKPDVGPPGSLFVLRDDPRLWATLSPELWKPRLSPLRTEGNLTIYELAPSSSAPGK